MVRKLSLVTQDIQKRIEVTKGVRYSIIGMLNDVSEKLEKLVVHLNFLVAEGYPFFIIVETVMEWFEGFIELLNQKLRLMKDKSTVIISLELDY